MQTMRKRLATRATEVFDRHGRVFDGELDDLIDAVLEELRTPTEGMLKAAELAGAYDGSGYHQAKRFWPAMIDHARKEGEDV